MDYDQVYASCRPGPRLQEHVIGLSVECLRSTYQSRCFHTQNGLESRAPSIFLQCPSVFGKKRLTIYPQPLQAVAANDAPIAPDAAGLTWLDPPTSLFPPLSSAAAAQSAIRAAQQEQNSPAAAQGLKGAPDFVPAPARSAPPAAPEPDATAPRCPPPSSSAQSPPAPPVVPEGVAVQMMVPPRQVNSVDGTLFVLRSSVYR